MNASKIGGIYTRVNFPPLPAVDVGDPHLIQFAVGTRGLHLELDPFSRFSTAQPRDRQNHHTTGLKTQIV